MHALDLYVEHKVRRDNHIFLFQYTAGEPAFFYPFYLRKFINGIRVAAELFNALYKRKVGYPSVIAQKARYERRKLRVAQRKPPARRYAVSFVLEIIGDKRVPFFQHVMLKYFRMYFGNAVYSRRSVNSQIGHVYNAAVYYGAFSKVLGESAALFIKLTLLPLIYFLYILIYIGQYPAVNFPVPFLKRFGHYRMVCIVEHAACHGESFLELHTVQVAEKAYELAHGYSRMRIVQLYCAVIRKA